MKKIVSVILSVILLVSVFALPASALETPPANNTNTSVTYIPIFEDFFNLESIFNYFEKIFSMFGFVS